MSAITLHKDPRYFQIIFQTCFITYGLSVLHWPASSSLTLIYFGLGMFVQLAGLFFVMGNKTDKASHLKKAFLGSLPSVIITGFGLLLLLHTESLAVASLATIVAIGSKFLIRIKGRHIFNPSALGIAVAVYLTGDAWISPGQWGSGAMLFFSITCLGFIITTKVQKLDVSIAFLLSFCGLMFLRQIVFLGWPMDYFFQSLSSGSLLLFSFFMITDPKTIPVSKWPRVLWAAVVGALSFYFVAFQFMPTAPILVLVLSQPVVPLLNHLYSAGAREKKMRKRAPFFPAFESPVIPVLPFQQKRISIT